MADRGGPRHKGDRRATHAAAQPHAAPGALCHVAQSPLALAYGSAHAGEELACVRL
jgi:hypothetical protein